MLEISIFNETFTIYTENFNELTIKNIKFILNEHSLYCKSNNNSINARGSYDDMYCALHDLSLEYHLLIS